VSQHVMIVLWKWRATKPSSARWPTS